MNLEPLLQAPIAVQIHVASAVPAAAIGPWLFWARKGTPLHRLAGKVWLGLMIIVALSSFFIHELNLFMGFSPIHLVSLYVLVGAWLAYRHARAGRIAQHKRQVFGLYLGGIVGAGGFTLVPGRIMHEVFFTYPAGWPSASGITVFLGGMAGFTLALLLLARLTTTGRIGTGTH